MSARKRGEVEVKEGQVSVKSPQGLTKPWGKTVMTLTAVISKRRLQRERHRATEFKRGVFY